MKLQIKSPFLWFGTPIGGNPKPWKHFKIDGLMPNAFDIMRSPSAHESVSKKGIHSHLGFHGLVMMDSGGFLFMKKRDVTISAFDVLDLYENGKPNLGVVLDHPLVPKLSNHVKRKRQLKTLSNTRAMVSNRKSSNPVIVPVVHGYTPDSIKWYLRRLDKIGHFPIYGIGSLVPSVFNTKGNGGIFNVIETIHEVRKHLSSEAKIHVFGIGSTVTMHLMYAAGADSLDSSAWRSKAAFGAIQLPGIGDRFITGRAGKATGKKYLNLSEEEKRTLEECRCPVCKQGGLPELKRSFTKRALHNAWVLQREVEKARRLLKENQYDDYVERVVGKTRFRNALRLARSLERLSLP